jgi:hypothetical protein
MMLLVPFDQCCDWQITVVPAAFSTHKPNLPGANVHASPTLVHVAGGSPPVPLGSPDVGGHAHSAPVRPAASAKAVAIERSGERMG